MAKKRSHQDMGFGRLAELVWHSILQMNSLKDREIPRSLCES